MCRREALFAGSYSTAGMRCGSDASSAWSVSARKIFHQGLGPKRLLAGRALIEGDLGGSDSALTLLLDCAAGEFDSVGDTLAVVSLAGGSGSEGLCGRFWLLVPWEVGMPNKALAGRAFREPGGLE
jgi:hypothetical protein